MFGFTGAGASLPHFEEARESEKGRGVVVRG